MPARQGWSYPEIVMPPIVKPLTVAICLALYGWVPGATRR